MSVELLDAAGRRRSPATLPGYRRGLAPRNKGQRYPADPPRVEEIIAVMRAAGDGVHGARMRTLVVVLWRAGLRIHEALALTETDLKPRRGSILVRHGECRIRHSPDCTSTELAQPSDGSFSSGTQMLTQIASWAARSLSTNGGGSGGCR